MHFLVMRVCVDDIKRTLSVRSKIHWVRCFMTAVISRACIVETYFNEIGISYFEKVLLIWDTIEGFKYEDSANLLDNKR